MDTNNKLPEDRKVVLEKIWKLHQRVQGWIQKNSGTGVPPSELNVARAVLRELEEYTAAVINSPDYRLTQQDLKSINRYWKAYK